MSAVEDLNDAVTKAEGVRDSVVAYANGVGSWLKAHAGDQQAIEDFATRLAAASASTANAVLANPLPADPVPLPAPPPVAAPQLAKH